MIAQNLSFLEMEAKKEGIKNIATYWAISCKAWRQRAKRENRSSKYRLVWSIHRRRRQHHRLIHIKAISQLQFFKGSFSTFFAEKQSNHPYSNSLNAQSKTYHCEK